MGFRESRHGKKLKQNKLYYNEKDIGPFTVLIRNVPALDASAAGFLRHHLIALHGGFLLVSAVPAHTRLLLDIAEYNIAVMPLLDYSYDIHTVMVSLYLKKSALSGCFEVGVMTDPTDESTFFPIDTLQNPTTIAFYPHHVYLNNYSGTGRYIAFRWRTYTAIFDPHYAWVDDITLQESTGCATVEELSASNVTGTSAVLRWNDGPIGTVTGHTIEYIDSDSTITTITDVVGNEFALSWLTPNTTYNVNVSANCDNDSTSLPASISFTTACASGGDLLFGEENHITSRNFPIHKYALTEEIYTASEIGAARNLQSVSFHCTTAGSDRNIALYLMPVEQSMLTGFIPINSTAVKVFDGIVNMSAGWVLLRWLLQPPGGHRR